MTTRIIGAKYSHEYRVYLENAKGQIISAFHDIPLWADRSRGLVNMICEIPRFSNAKLEISKADPMNPIRQDVKKEKLRFVRNVFPFHGYPWNYGALPQTWESPEETDPDTGMRGDNDPLDVIEIGGKIMATGQVSPVKVLGLLGLLDEGETDWKVLVIDASDPMADRLNDIGDVEEHCPGLLEATRRWFRLYKIPDGKPANQFAFGGEARDRAHALGIIEKTHGSWKELLKSSTQHHQIALENREQEDHRVSADAYGEAVIPKNAALPDRPLDSAVIDAWAYIPRDQE